MKIKACMSILAIVSLLAFSQAEGTAQSKKTIILVRHAEKVAPVDTDKGDADLSPEGHERAERLMRAIKKYRPGEIFVTDYKRTRQTAEPIANRRKIQIQTYDPVRQTELVSTLIAGKTKRYLIVGHSNSIPALANLLMKKEIFKQLPDSEYGVFWVIRIKKGAVKKVEVFPY